MLTSLASVTAYWRTEYNPCKESRSQLGVEVSYLYCDMFKLSNAGYRCNESFCESPKNQCIKDGRDPIAQAKAFLVATGACGDLSRVKYDIVKHISVEPVRSRHRLVFSSQNQYLE
ncbi:hypothetical protein FBU30_004414 [Linnemannia zychae]|nr:hypothetical protein FBU30_004414 [Linnemannia zychae]